MLYLHPDHLGAPRVVSNEQGIVWSWNSDAFGLGAPNEDTDGDGQTTEVPLRLPGQLWDNQTQLAYNYYRDYDANLGRYIQSDPIGLRGGANTYAYVAGNPLGYTDPQGLNPVAAAAAVCSRFPAACAATGAAIYGAGRRR